ncbi:putative acyl-CoA synthetase [Actinacidiphila reveromycinica]|uniref:Putative acyl-CoA synthetase n=1 Tax=Actinacidiphila reveromycinica TaxID=659352 RepID=A0A7U3VMZ4_9ACTN|nr:long-chain-fatty-acid--CoA ligase [Streptomyces sp. SN-593]BBA97107.1 putative acyl-CoA synthetase [Streptomyces sp. SN-593]
MYLTQSLHRAVRQSPDVPFTVFNGRAHTARQTYDVVSRLAGGLRGLGVRKDDRVGLLSLNTDRFCQIALATAWADAAVVPLNTRWSATEHAYAVDDAEASVLFVDDAFLPMVAELRAKAPGLRTLVHCGDAPTPEGLVPLSDLLAAEPVEDAHRQGDAMAGIFYTGGTTGLPKGVMLGHRQLYVTALGTLLHTRLPRGGASILAAPAFHLAGFAFWIVGMMADMTTVPVALFDPVGILRTVQEHRARQTLLVPAMIQAIVSHPEAGAYDLSSLELLAYGASPISETLLTRARAAFPSAQFLQVYGMTELSPSTTLLQDADHDDPVLRRSVGQAAPYARVRIVDEKGTEVPPGTIGEIVAAGDHVMLGYWKKPAETAEAVRDGWMHTGDVGYMDERGYVFVVDRLKDMIVSGGENVYSTEVENVVAKHPAVAQVAVIGLPDDRWGERVHAVVTLAPGATLTLEELSEFCRREIAGYKCPRSLESVDQFPMSGAGKILKRELRASVRSGTGTPARG